MIEVGTVCTGIGSPEQALRELAIPHKIKFAVEKDKYARETYLANFNPQFIANDMTKQDWNRKQFKCDILIGGIPCQSFSLAGKRLGELDPRGLLFYDFYNCVKIQNPKYFIIENVKGLLSDNEGNTFRNWINLLGQSENGSQFFFPHEDSLMYNLHWQVLNSKDYELPQNRERVFLIGIRNDIENNFVFPKKKRLIKRLKHILEFNVDKKYYLSDKMLKGFIERKENGTGFAKQFDIKSVEDIANCITTSPTDQPQSNYINYGYINQNTQSSQVFSSEGISPTITAGTHGYALGYVKTDEIIQLNNPKHSNDRVYDSNGILPTLNTMQGGNRQPFIAENDGIKNNTIRRLTPLECFRLQGFPDEFIKPCSDSQTYKQAGNTISVTVIKAILKNLLKHEN